MPLLILGIAPISFAIGVVALGQIFGPEYQHSQNLWRGVFFLAWALLGLTAVAVSCTTLVFVAREMRLWLRIATVALSVPVLLVAAAAFVAGTWSLQDYSGSFAAYDTAVEICGHPPAIAETGWAAGYMLPNTSDYERQKYTTHDRFIFGGTRYYCTAADAQAAGLRQH